MCVCVSLTRVYICVCVSYKSSNLLSFLHILYPQHNPFQHLYLLARDPGSNTESVSVHSSK